MTNYSDEKHRRIEQFAKYLRLMGLRRRKFVEDDDCFAIFDESAPAGIDAPQPRNRRRSRWKPPPTAARHPTRTTRRTRRRPTVVGKAPPLRPVRFGEDCFYVDLSNRALLPHEAESILQQRAGFYWAKDRPNLRWVRTNWKDVVKSNPLQKVYLYRDEQSGSRGHGVHPLPGLGVPRGLALVRHGGGVPRGPRIRAGTPVYD